jgi:arginine repressor
MKNAVSRMLRSLDLVRTDVSEERIAYSVKVNRISKLGITLAVEWCLLGCYAVWLN